MEFASPVVNLGVVQLGETLRFALHARSVGAVLDAHWTIGEERSESDGANLSSDDDASHSVSFAPDSGCLRVPQSELEVMATLVPQCVGLVKTRVVVTVAGGPST